MERNVEGNKKEEEGRGRGNEGRRLNEEKKYEKGGGRRKGSIIRKRAHRGEDAEEWSRICIT